MGIRGRKSSAELAVVPAEVARILPAPPEHLTPEQSEIWRLVIASKAGDLIPPESYPVVVEYCRSITAANQIAKQIKLLNEKWMAKTDDEALMSDTVLDRLDKLQAMQERMMRVIASLAVKLRLTPSTQVHPEKAGTVQRRAGGLMVAPWQIDEDE